MPQISSKTPAQGIAATRPSIHTEEIKTSLSSNNLIELNGENCWQPTQNNKEKAIMHIMKICGIQDYAYAELLLNQICSKEKSHLFPKVGIGFNPPENPKRPTSADSDSGGSSTGFSITPFAPPLPYDRRPPKKNK